MTQGLIVVSKAGRDVGRRFVVTRVLDEMYVTIADGDLRRIEKPKKKKIKHLEPTGEIGEAILERLKSDTRITNSELRKLLAQGKLHRHEI